MKPASPHLLEAIERYQLIGEDRLTELLACVLDQDIDAANRLLDRLRLPTSERVDVFTQREVEGGRIDVDMHCFDARDRLVAHVWLENKAGADFSYDQLPKYARAITHSSVPGKLAAVAPTRAEIPKPPAGARWERLTWQDIADDIAAAGASHGYAGRSWRRDARRSQAPAIQRIRDELVSYLERRNYAVMDPLSQFDIVAIANTTRALSVLDELLERAGDHVSHRLRLPKPVGWTEDASATAGMYWPPWSWASSLANGGYPDLLVSETDFWADSRADEPAFGAGFSFEYPAKSDFPDWCMAPTRAAWRDKLADARFSLHLGNPTDRWVRAHRTMYLAELLPKGATLDDQARALGLWVGDAFADLRKLAPPKARKSSARVTRRVATTQPVDQAGGDISVPNAK